MPIYRRKSYEVEAEQFTGEIPSILYDENDEVGDLDLGVSPDDDLYTYITIHDIYGAQVVDRGDWVIKRDSGDYNVYTDEAFNALFEKI